MICSSEIVYYTYNIFLRSKLVQMNINGAIAKEDTVYVQLRFSFMKHYPSYVRKAVKYSILYVDVGNDT
jgi:hypothetical protein